MGEVDAAMAELGLVREPIGGLPDDVRWERRPGDAFGSRFHRRHRGGAVGHQRRLRRHRLGLPARQRLAG